MTVGWWLVFIFVGLLAVVLARMCLLYERPNYSAYGKSEDTWQCGEYVCNFCDPEVGPVCKAPTELEELREFKASIPWDDMEEAISVQDTGETKGSLRFSAWMEQNRPKP